MLESVEAVNIRAAAKDSEEGKNQTVIFCKSPSVFGTKKVFRCTQVQRLIFYSPLFLTHKCFMSIFKYLF
ncbi:hypothetical protein EB796_023064 [Bugula neritina]|uniref:Uncharacterized protein n=1 Tax=Bugula neritina TaxID=10212 RepID=A0A7J7IXI1_BUGNE|nr:hypothetical protein EB796_023064 [Bugula neritina]